MTTTQRNQLYRKLHALLNELGISDSKEVLLSGYGVESTRRLSDHDLIDLVNRVNGMKVQKAIPGDRLRQLRSEVLTILNEMGIYATNNDWTRINSFLMDKRIAGKLLYELTIDELVQLRPKLRSIAKKLKERREMETHLALMN